MKFSLLVALLPALPVLSYSTVATPNSPSSTSSCTKMTSGMTQSTFLASSTTTETDAPKTTTFGATADAVFSPDDAMFTSCDKPTHNNKFSDDDLIIKAKQYLFANQGVDAPELLSETFQFHGPVVGGPDGLTKAAYLEAVGGFKITEGFPDLNPRFHHFRVDPIDGRVWFTSRATGTHTGTLFGIHKPTGISFETPPQACSLTFDQKDGTVTKYTIGHVMDVTVGNTGGMGGIFGPLYAIGKPLPFPEAKPYKQSWRFWAFTKLGNVAQKLSKK